MLLLWAWIHTEFDFVSKFPVHITSNTLGFKIDNFKKRIESIFLNQSVNNISRI